MKIEIILLRVMAIVIIIIAIAGYIGELTPLEKEKTNDSCICIK